MAVVVLRDSRASISRVLLKALLVAATGEVNRVVSVAVDRSRLDVVHVAAEAEEHSRARG